MQIPAGTVPMGKQSKPGRSSGPMVMSASHDPARRASRPASPVPMDVSVRACRCLSKNAAMFARAFALLQNAGATRNSRSLTGFSSQDSLISSSSRNDESTSVAFFRNALPRGVSAIEQVLSEFGFEVCHRLRHCLHGNAVLASGRGQAAAIRDADEVLDLFDVQ